MECYSFRDLAHMHNITDFEASDNSCVIFDLSLSPRLVPR